MADESDHEGDSSPFQPSTTFPSVTSEDSKESITKDYIKVGGEDDVGGNSSPEVISLPSEEEPPADPSPVHLPRMEPPPPETKRDPSPPAYDPPPLRYSSGVEDVVSLRRDESRPSPSRPAAKNVDTVRAEGYLKFLNVFPPQVLNIIYWKDLKLSALSLVTSLAVLLTLYLNTILHTAVLLLLAAMVVSLLYMVTKIAVDSFYNKPIQNPFSAYLQSDIVFLNEEAAVCLVRRAVDETNHYANLTMKLIFFENWTRSLKFVVVLFLASYLTNYLDVMTTLFLGIDILFGLPPLYTKYRQMIDNAIDKALAHLADLYSKVSSRLPFLPKLKSD